MAPFPAGFILHSYGGPPDLVGPFSACGGYFSISGLITSLKRDKAKAILEKVGCSELHQKSARIMLACECYFWKLTFLFFSYKIRWCLSVPWHFFNLFLKQFLVEFFSIDSALVEKVTAVFYLDHLVFQADCQRRLEALKYISLVHPQVTSQSCTMTKISPA